jgi:hypothetical protein
VFKDWKQTSSVQQRPELFYVLLILVLHTISWVPRFHGSLDLRWDGAVYYVLGTSIAQGSGYRLLYEPGAIQANQYPPGLPLIVAAHQTILNSSDPIVVGRALRRTWFLLSSITVLAVYALARRYLQYKYALTAAILYAVQTDGAFLSTLCFAELPYTCLTLLFLLTIARPEHPYPALTTSLAALAYLTRTLGITALAAWVAESLIRRDFRQAALRTLIAAVPVLCWIGYTRFVERSEAYQDASYSYQRADYMFYNVSYERNMSYRDPFQPELGRITLQERAFRSVTNLAWIPYQLGVALSTHWNLWRVVLSRLIPTRLLDPLLTPLIACLGLVALAGLVILAFRGHLVEFTYVFLTLLAVSATPWPTQSWRYLYPISPLFGIAFLIAVQTLITGASAVRPRYKPVLRWVEVTALCGLVALNCLFLLTVYRWYSTEQTLSFQNRRASLRMFYYDDAWRSLDAALDCLATTYDQSSRVMSSVPAWIYLRTGATSMMPPFVSNRAEAARLIATSKASYVVIDEVDGGAWTKRFAEPVLGQGEWLRICDTTVQGGRVYKRTGD